MSYFYLRGRVKNRMSEFIEELADFDTVLIDSGAFTFMNSGTPFKGIEGNSPEAFAKRKAITEKYTYEYAEFLSQIKDHITGAFEMDYDLGFGSEQCWKWYDVLASSGARVIPVYHGDAYDKKNPEWIEDTPEVFEKWCASGKYEYIAIGSSFFQDDKFKPQVPRLLRIAKKYKVRVHGLGATGFHDIKNAPLYTVDSTSWLSGNRFGATFFFQNGRVKSYDKDHKSVRKRWRSACEKYGIDFAKLVADENHEVEAWNALQWKLFADAMEMQHRNRKMEYWLGRRLEGKMAENLRGEDYEDLEEEIIDEGDDEEETGTAIIVPDNVQEILHNKARKLDERGIINNSQMAVAGVLCNNCYLGDRCPYYKENNACQIDVDVTLKDGKDMLSLMQTILEMQTERTLRGVYVEKMDGGMINAEVSKEIDKTVALMQRFKEMVEPNNEVTISAKGQGGTGVLAQIFGLGNKGGQ